MECLQFQLSYIIEREFDNLDFYIFKLRNQEINGMNAIYHSRG